MWVSLSPVEGTVDIPEGQERVWNVSVTCHFPVIKKKLQRLIDFVAA